MFWYLKRQVAQGTGLSFIAFTEAITKMPAPQVWSVLFFCMLITLGMGSMFGNIAGVVTPILDMGLVKMKKEYLNGLYFPDIFLEILNKWEFRATSSFDPFIFLLVPYSVKLFCFSDSVFSFIPYRSLILSKFRRILASTLRFLFSESRVIMGRHIPSYWHEFCLWNRKVCM